MDQVRLDRTWMIASTTTMMSSAVDGNGGVAPISPPPGYEVTTLSHTAHDKYDVLLYYDWVCATVDPIDKSKPSNGERGAIGFLAHRKRLQMKRNNKSKRKQVRSMRYLAVHVVDYPSLQPVVTHTFFHRGFGWRTNLADLPRATNVNDNHVLSLDAPWIATLLLVDYKRKQYALAYTDEYGVSALVLRSYVDDAPSNGKTIGSFFFEGHSNGTFLRIVDDATYRFYFTDNIGDSYTHMHLLSRDTLAPISSMTIPVETHFFDHFPDHNRNLLMVASMHGEVSFWDVTTGQLQEWIQATPGHQLHVMFFRPLFRPGLLTESPPSRPNRAGSPEPSSSTSTPHPIHEQRPWIQLIIGWLNCLPGLEHLSQNTGACLFNISSLPLTPRTSLDQLTAAPADRSPYPQNQGIRSMSMILGTPFLAGDITGHLMAVLQPNGRVVMIDLRAPSSPVESRSNSVDDSDPLSKPTVGLQPVKTTPLWFMSRAAREYALVHGELLDVSLPVDGEARVRALGKTNLKLVARRIHGDTLHGAADLIQRAHSSTMSADLHSVGGAAQVIAAEDGVTDASDGEWEDEEEVTEIAPGQFVSVEDESESEWSEASSQGDSSNADTTGSTHPHENGLATTAISDMPQSPVAANSSSSDAWPSDGASDSSQWEDESESSHGNEESGSDWSDDADDEENEEGDQDEWSHENAGDLMFLDSRGNAMLIHRGSNLVLLRRVQR
ncbi:hypothetical protein BCR44DRAFT_1436810 [Catenaria anguillulae PL171]|uniref:Uncharacterized protein n=1 Tax=Catenaria anguillulae PL171 TaxID=765915 RepID=A0A1Y2HI32_9FUNG|nr:hypothetical protein BCR44DRAFT_1436810 [Catenaria anguillulae PL171]